jgi:iron complex outermembrane receptor protein/vitamin B12 transporter
VRLLSTSLLLAALAAPAPAAARPQPSPPAPAEPSPAGESDGAPTPAFYETTTVVARPVSSASGAVSLLEADDIRASEARSTGELLASVPGFHVLSSGGRAGQTSASIRGGDPNFTLVLLDGVPLNDSTDLQGGAVNLEELPAGLVERAEVVRGPLTSFYGTSSLSGVVQLFTPRGGPGPVRASLGAEAGDASLRRGYARVSGPLDGGGGGFAAGTSYDEESERIAGESFRQIDAWGSASVPLGASRELRLVGRFADGSTEDYPDASGGPVYGTGELRASDHRDLALVAQLRLGEPSGRPQRILLGLSHRSLERASPAVPPEVPASRESTDFTRARVGWHSPVLRGSRTEVDAGVSGEVESGRNASVLELPPAFGGDVPGDYEETRATAGVYAGVRRQQGPWLLEGALRADVATSDGAQLNPHAGVVFAPGAGRTRLRASIGRASKLPSFFALASPRALGGNPDLKPERAWGGEAGIEQEIPPARLVLGAAYFRQDYRDVVDFDFEQFLHVNRADVRSQGLEVTVRWQPHPTLSLDGQLTYADTVDLSGAPLLQQPHWRGAGRLTWRPTPAVSLQLSGRGVSSYLDRQIPVPDRDTVDGHGVLALAGSWRVGRGLTLRGRADNLTDRAYETYIGFPGPGRSFWVGLGWDRS